MIVTPSGAHMILRDFVEHLYQRGAAEIPGRRVVFSQVFLSDHPRRPLYVVASWRAGEDKPLILLTTLAVETVEQARGGLRYYR